MKLQQQVNKIVKGKKYFKYVFIIRTYIIKALGWKKTDKFELTIEGDSIRIRRKIIGDEK